MFKLIKENIIKPKSYDGYIIESSPNRFYIEPEKLENLINHIENGIKDGFTEEEAEILLKWTVENTRKNLEIYLNTNINSSPLFGCCGFAQCSSLAPLEKIKGIKITYKNTMNFEYVTPELRHAFGVVGIPIKTNSGIEYKNYLIDTTLRQFYTSKLCQKQTKTKNKYQADPGYFMCLKNKNIKQTRKLAQTLLKNGYIELKDITLKQYIDSFIYSSIMKYYPQQEEKIIKLPLEWYEKKLNEITYEEQDFYEVDLRELGFQTKICNSKEKTR